jgi:hypothetical protein
MLVVIFCITFPLYENIQFLLDIKNKNIIEKDLIITDTSTSIVPFSDIELMPKGQGESYYISKKLFKNFRDIEGKVVRIKYGERSRTVLMIEYK